MSGFPYAPAPMRRALTLLAIATTGLAASACGGDDKGGDEDQVRSATKEFVTGLAAGNGRRTCAQMTTAARKEVVDTVTAAYPDPELADCEPAIEALSEDIESERKQAMLNPRFAKVEIVGDSAEVTVKGVTGKTKLSRVDGDWQVAGTEIVG